MSLNRFLIEFPVYWFAILRYSVPLAQRFDNATAALTMTNGYSESDSPSPQLKRFTVSIANVPAFFVRTKAVQNRWRCVLRRMAIVN
jgi:hypothetical protein